MEVKVTQSCPALCDRIDYTVQARNTLSNAVNPMVIKSPSFRSPKCIQIKDSYFFIFEYI